MLWDAHMHSSFSGDCDISPEEMIATAKNKNLMGITFTDHMDYDYLPEHDLFLLDTPAYFKKMQELKFSCSNDSFQVLMGIEIGLQPHLSDQLNELINHYPFDYVIGSSHVVHGIDPYYDGFYDNRSEDEAYLDYFSSILENLSAYDNFDSYGHLDYVVRYGPNKDRFYSYEKFAEIIDEILKKLIGMDKALEVNTGAFRCGLSHPNPTEAIIRRYHELGGKLLTIGADAHKPEHIALEFSRLPQLLHSCGVTEYTVYQQRKPVFYPI